MVPAPGELVLVMVNPVMPVALRDEAVVGLLAVGVDGGLPEDLPLDDGQQILAAARFHRFDVDAPLALEQTDDGDLPGGSPASFAPHPPWSEIALVDFDPASERGVLPDGDRDDPGPEEGVEPMGSVLVETAEEGGLRCGDVQAEALQKAQELPFREVRSVALSVIHPDAVEALRALWAMPGRAVVKRRGKVFYRGVTRMERFLEDLEEAGVSEFDEAGRRLEFHGFRRTWATFLNSGRVPPRVAMGLMRHCDMRLTMQTYTDESLLPMAEALKQTPSVKSSLSSGKSCQKVAIFDKKRRDDGKLNEFITDSKSMICESKKMTEGVGFEPTDGFPSAVFKTAAINHSTTPPEMDVPPLVEAEEG